MATATERLEFRVAPERKARISHAARLLNIPVSEFALAAAEKEADAVLADHAATTVVPDEFFADLLTALEAPAVAPPALVDAIAIARTKIVRD